MKLYHELAEYYFTIEDKQRDFNDDISLIRTLLHGKNNPSLLDLGCGTGEHLNQLSRYGINCIGIDNSEDMLNVAKSRFPDKMELIKADITKFDFYNEFDIIISLFGSLNYLINDSEVDKALWNTWRALKPAGIGLFEIWNALPIRQITKKNTEHVSTVKYNDIIIDRKRGFSLLNFPDKTVVEVSYKYKIHNNEDLKTVSDYHIMRAFTIEEITKYLSENGFIIKEIFSNTLKEPYKKNSNKIIVHFEKN